jgi:large subunit ribosomal protein L29
MKASEMRNKSVVELQNDLASALKELFNLRLQDNVDSEQRSIPKNGIKSMRRKIARMKTVLNEKRRS